MEKELTSEEKLIREISEKNNPYASECPNKHLWSEGFRSGYKYAIGICDFADAVFKKPVEIPEITDEEVEGKASDLADPLSRKDFSRGEWLGFKEGAKWYREEQRKRMTK
jgi:hypothetical protein